MSDLQVGQSIELTDGRHAVIRFIGTTHFSDGSWVGIELEDGSGKNDGSVLGERYFACAPKMGMFVRPTAISQILQAAPPPKPANGGVTKKPARPSSINGPAGKRVSAVADAGAGKRLSMNAASPSPAPAPRGSRTSSLLRSPTKSPTKQLSSAGTSATTSRTGTPSNTKPPSITTTKPRPSVGGARTSMGPPAAPGSRVRLSSTSSTSSSVRGAPTRTLSGQSSLAPQSNLQTGAGRLTSIGSQLSSGNASEGSGQENQDDARSISPDKSDLSEALSPKSLSPVLSRTSAAARSNASPSSNRGNSPATQRSGGGSTVASREIEDLKTKMRLMEKKRMEDREKLKALDKIQVERDKFESIIQKLQAKYQPQQQEVTELRKQLKESATRLEELETKHEEHDTLLEMATLDREMAEETTEVMRTELEALKQKGEELELEVEVLREENAELSSEMTPEEKTSQGWLQMERNNERLREALIRLRDMTQQTESELRDEIKSLGEDVKELASVKEHYDMVKEKLAQSEAGIEDLREQLDNALGAEDMIEELGTKNENLTEQVEELKLAIEDLESLKELNDELEINHVETEKEMQEELDFKDNVISEQARRAAQQEEAMEDMDYTLSRFRELVTNLQSDLEDMRASHAVTETESEQLNSRSRAMADLNMKLQVSAAKTQVKTIDLELRRLDAQEASEHLAIVQLFLPDAYQADRDSVLALLRFRRVAFKASLIHGFVKEKVNGQLPSGHEDDIFAACDVLDKLSWVSAMCERFVNSINHCTPEEFAKYEGALYELEPVERALNSWIDSLRRDELKEKQCASELQRTIALLSHLGEVHIAPNLASYADEIHMRSLVMQNQLENAAAAMSAIKTMVQTIIPSQGEEDELAEHFSRKSEFVITQTRSAKVVIGKAVRFLEDLKTRSLSLIPDTLDAFSKCESFTQEVGDLTRRIGFDLHTLLHEEGRIEPFTYIEVQSTVQQTTLTIFATSDTDLFSTSTTKLRTLSTHLNDLSSLTTSLELTQEFERLPPPWVLRSQELGSTKHVPPDAEDELRRLKEENHERARLIALRDQTLEESSVKIELLESRMRDAGKKNDRITELERRVEEARKREAELAESVESRDKELAGLEAERDRWRKVAEGATAVGAVSSGGTKEGAERAVATAKELDALRLEIANLQAAVRFLREDNRRIRLGVTENIDWLSQPLLKPKTKDDKRRELIRKEGNEVLDEILSLVTASNVKVFRMRSVGEGEDRLRWRPVKETSGWWVERRREDYEAWRGWSEGVVRRGREVLGVEERREITRRRGRGEVLAKLQFHLPSAEGTKYRDGEVQIVEPGEWEGLRGRLGFV